MKKKLYFVNLHYPNSYSEVISKMPNGAGYVLESVERAGIDVKYWEFSFIQDIDKMISDIIDYSPDLIGFSFYSYRYLLSYEILNKVSSLNIPIICGGVHVNTIGKKILEETSVDFLLSGEGEESLIKFIRNIGDESVYKNIPGLIYRNGNKIIENKREPINLKTVNFPRFNSFDQDKYYNDSRSILSSRGCPYSCTFCTMSSLLSKKWRARTPEQIIQEMEYWASRNITSLTFSDDNFTMDKNRVIELCKLIQKSQYQYNLFIAGIRINNVDFELLKIMRESGFYFLSFGIESGNDRVLKEIKKGITLNQIHNTLEMTLKLNFKVKLYFIINNRTETFKEAQDSFKLARMYPIEIATFSNLVPYPGTYDFEWIKKYGTLLYSPEIYMNKLDEFRRKPIYDGPGMSIEERKRLIKDSIIEFKRFDPCRTQKMRKAFKMVKYGQIDQVFLSIKRKLGMK